MLTLHLSASPEKLQASFCLQGACGQSGPGTTAEFCLLEGPGWLIQLPVHTGRSGISHIYMVGGTWARGEGVVILIQIHHYNNIKSDFPFLDSAIGKSGG